MAQTRVLCIFGLALLLLKVVWIEAGNSAVSPHEITADLMTPLFNIMQKFGEKERDAINEEIRKENANADKKDIFRQHLVVTVVSKSEIRDSSNWGGEFPSSFTEPSGNENRMRRRVAFLLNDRNHSEIWYNPGRELHGEVQALDFGYLQTLMENFKQDRPNMFPIVVFYSHYIPCAKVPRLGYSCSEELMKYAKNNLGKAVIVVAYLDIFKNTNVANSIDFMKNGGVLAFQKMQTSQLYEPTVKVFPPTSFDSKHGPFQAEFYDCLMHLPASRCCVKENRRVSTVAFFINQVTYKCTVNSNMHGSLTELSRKMLKDCISLEINQRIGDDCIHCSTKNPALLAATKFLYRFCLINSADSSTHIGTVIDASDVPGWNKYEGAFKLLYNRKKPTFTRTQCANSKNSVASLCTMDISSITENSKKQKRYIKKLSGEKYQEDLSDPLVRKGLQEAKILPDTYKTQP